jgi:pimeloyl-ACP methyl ester carboxylesterase
MKPHLVFLHGFGEDARIWQDFMPDAFSKHTTHYPNFAEWTDCSSIAAYAQKIVQSLPLDTQFIFIGHSMGGYVALEIASQFPSITSGVVMLHSTCLADSPEKKNQREKTASFITEHGTETFIRSFVGNLFTPTFVDEHRETLNQLITRYQGLDARGLVAATLAMKERQDFQAFLQNTPIPFLFVLGDLDPLIPVGSILEILAGKDQHKYVILEGVAHQGCYEAPEQTLQAILAFINEFHV